ncbi:MAG: hypothetical protein MJ252_14905 [archaeon]|nr:hypothetical protein [archaeon]
MFHHHKKDKGKDDPKESVEALKKKIEDLKKENADTGKLMVNTLRGKDLEITKVKDENKELKEKLEKAPKEEDIQKLNSQIEEANNKNILLEQDKMNLHRKIQILTTDKEKYDEDLKRVQNELEENKNKFMVLVNEKKDLQRQVEVLKKELTEREENKNKEGGADATQYKLEKEKAEKSSKELLVYSQKLKEDLKELQEKYNEEVEKNKEQSKLLENTQKQLSEYRKKSLDQMNEEAVMEMHMENKPQQKNSVSNSEEEKFNQTLADILSDYLVKTNANKFSVSLFDLLQTIIVNLNVFDEIVEYAENIETINELPVLIYEEIQRYVLNNFMKIDQLKLNDFLQNSKLVSQSNYDKNIIDLIKKVKYFNDKNNLIFDQYKKKKDTFNKMAENNFNVIKNFIVEKYKAKADKSMLIHYQLMSKLIKMDKTNTSVDIDFRQIFRANKTNQTNSLIPYLIKDKISSVEHIKVSFSEESILDDGLFFMYFIKLYNTKIKSLSLSFDGISPSPLKKYFQERISLILNTLTELTKFEVRNLDILPENLETKQLIKTLINSKIDKLSLIHCITKYSSFYFSEYLSKTKKLTEFTCSENLEKDIIPTFIPYFKTQDTLLSINLSANPLSQTDFESISEFMQGENHLKSINLSNIKMTTENCNTLGLALRKTKGLEALILNSCGLSEENFMLVFNRNTSMTLKKISLDQNKFGDSGITCLGTYLKGNSVFNYLSIRNCGFSLQGFSVLKIILNVSLTKNAEVHVEDNALIEVPQIVDFFGECKSLVDKGIKIYVERKNLNKKTVDKLLTFEEVALV